jgi:hypothetical protein
MRICVVCGSEHADDVVLCPYCGGELRKRSISDAINLLLEAEEKANASARFPCPHCGASVLTKQRGGTCPNCGITLNRRAEADDHTALIRH